MIYSSPIESITWIDVEEFCKQAIVEGSFLEYKRDFPTDLGRTISAMGNTLGGIILIGIEEGIDGKPVLPLGGIPFERGLSERITNIVLTNITPPLFPEVAICESPDKQRALAVVRVPQSPNSPHAITHNTRVYVRTGNRNSAETLATLEEIDWLSAKRKRSTLLRDHLFAEATRRSDELFGHRERSIAGSLLPSSPQSANLILRVIPQFPGQSFLTPPELKKALRSIQIPDYYGTDAQFPLGGSNAILLQNGVYVTARLDGETGQRSYYTELSVFGQLYFRQTLATKWQGKSIVRASEVFCRLDEFAAISKKFFSVIGYQGFASFLCSIYGATSVSLGQWAPEGHGMSLSNCPDDTIGHESTFLVSDWDLMSTRTILAAAKLIGWAFNWDLSDELIEAYYSSEGRARNCKR